MRVRLSLEDIYKGREMEVNMNFKYSRSLIPDKYCALIAEVLGLITLKTSNSAESVKEEE